MKRFTITFSALAVAGVVAASAVAATQQGAMSAKTATVLIRHQLHGCHAWSVNGGAFAPSRSLVLKTGGVVTFTNNDVMPQRLVERSGRTVLYAGNKALSKPGSVVRATLTKPGRYVFGTKPGEDYTRGVKTTGTDNVLKLVVTVS